MPGMKRKQLQPIFLGLLVGLCLISARAHAQSTNCVAGTWGTPNLAGVGPVGLWPINASSTHFDLHYDPALGATDPNLMQNSLTLLENVWSQFMGAPINWPEPFCNSTTKDKVQVFLSEQYWAEGGGFNTNDMGMWWNPQAILDSYSAGYEFTHALQLNSLGLQGTNVGGWFWETHSGFMTMQLSQNEQDLNCEFIQVAEPHLFYGSDRDNFCIQQFWQYEADQYGYQAINNIWANSPRPGTAGTATADPIFIYSNNMGWTQSQLNDEFGRWAMANVNWDQYIRPDGTDEGPLYRATFGPNTANSGVNDPYNPNWTRNRATQLDAVNASQRVFQVPSYWAPQRFGYNLVRLIPDAGVSSVTVNFTGMVQNSLTATTFGSHANEPATVPPANSDWRWGLVAIDVDGNTRKSPLQSGASASLTFNVEPDDQGLYMTVVGTPTAQQSIMGEQVYYSIYRYPWMVQLENAYPDGYQPGFQRLNPPGSVWPNGGGWVATGVTPDPTVYIGPHAAVLGGSVTQNAVITDNAVVWNGSVSGNAVIGGLTQWNNNLSASGNAVIKVVKDVQTLLSPSGTNFSGTVEFLGDAEEYVSPSPTSGVFYGFMPEAYATQNQYGADFTTPPVEVTAPVQFGTTAQTINFAAVPTQTAGSTYALSVNATSGLPVGLFSQTPTVCSIAGTILDALASGTCTVLASQPGNTTYAAAPTVTSSFTVSAAAAQTISFPAIASQPVNTSLPLYAWASSGLAVTFSSGSTSVCTVSGSTLSMVALGTCSVTASQGGNASTPAATPVTQTFSVVALKSQTINFSASDITYVNGTISTSFNPAATATSGLTVTFSSQTPSVCTASGATVNVVAVGTCTVTASQPGNTYYAAATPVTNSFAAHALDQQTIAFPAIGTQNVNATITLTAEASSGVAVTYTTSTPSICTLNGGVLTTVAAGTCSVTASQAGGGIYAAATPVTQTFTVTLLAQTITFPTIASQNANTSVALTASASSGLTVSYTTSTPAVCTVTGTTLSAIGSGTCSVTASQSGNATYAAAAAVTNTFTVVPLTQTITFAPASPVTYGVAPILLSATASSGLPVTFTIASGPGSLSGSTLTVTGAGTIVVAANQAGNSSYSAATQVTASIVVNPASQTITFAAIPGQTTGTSLTLTATATSGLAVSFASSTPTICTVSGSTASLLAAGTCTLVASQSGNSSYAPATSITQSFTVAAGTFTLSLASTTISLMPNNGVADALTVNPLNGFTGAVTLSLSSLPAGVSASFYPSNPTTSSTNLVVYVPSGTTPGSYPLTITGVSASLTVTTPATLVIQGTQTITFAAIATQTAGGSLTLNATASSGLAVSYSSSTPSVCTVSGSTVSLIAAGTCTVTAAQAGNTIYTAATPVSQSFTVAPKLQSQTITFAAIPTQTSGTSLALNATATSGLAVSFASSTPSICTVSGSTASLLAGGTCTLTASQAGNSTYSAATSVSQSFTVLQSQTITFNSIPPQKVGTTLTVSATASSGLPVTFTVVQNGNCSVSGNVVTFLNTGNCGVLANQAGNSTYAAAAQVGQIVVVNAQVMSQTITFNSIPSQKIGTSLTVSATASSGLPVTFTVVQNGNCSVSGNVVTFLNYGNCGIIANQSGNASYSAAPAVGQIVPITN